MSSSPATTPAPVSSWVAANETRLVWFFAALLLLVNLFTAEIHPTSWCDEAMFADPAINFAHGKGFVSTAWWQPKEVTWSGNVPLYTSVLVGWVKIFGAGLVQVRAFNFLIISLVIPVFWLGVKKLGCIPSATARVAMIVTAFLSYSFCFAYRTARPDCLGILIFAWALWSWTLPNKSIRYLFLFLAGCLMPTSGLQLIGYFGLLSVLIYFMAGNRAIVPLFVMGAGIFAGGLGLFAFYYFNHLDGVMATIRQTRQAHETAVALGSEHGGKFLAMTKRIVFGQLKDYGISPTLIALAVLATVRSVRDNAKMRSLIIIGFVASFAMVFALELFLHYLEYYHWMTYVLLIVLLFTILSHTWATLGRPVRCVILLLLTGSIMGGLPLRLGLGIATHQRPEYVEIKKQVAESIQPSDIVFTDFMGYFPMKARVREIYLPSYLSVMTEAERKSINVLVLDHPNTDWYVKMFSQDGQRWQAVGGFDSNLGPAGNLVRKLFPHYQTQPTSCGYAVTILRRDPQGPIGKP